MAAHFDNVDLAELDALHTIRFWTAPTSPTSAIGARRMQAFHCQCCRVMFRADTNKAQLRRHLNSAQHLKAKAKFEKADKEIDDIIDAAVSRRNGGGKGGGKGGGGKGASGGGVMRAVK